MNNLIFLKLGGSLITDKTQVETTRPDVIERVSAEIRTAIQSNPDLQLILGHGSGSFGHVAGAKHGTRHGVNSAEQWFGFTDVGQAAARLNAFVRDALFAQGVPVLSLQPHNFVMCEDGAIVAVYLRPLRAALAAGLLPLVMGDVAFDQTKGGIIVSTEEVMSAISAELPPRWLLLAGETDGVYDLNGNVLPFISRNNFAEIRAALGGSRGTDVTGGMLAKVMSMLELCDTIPHLKIRIFSGLQAGNIEAVLTNPTVNFGTVIQSE